MSGVFGIVDLQSAASLDVVIERMGATLRHRDWIQTDTAAETNSGVALGRAHIGIFNTAPQPVFDSARGICLVMTGELYCADGIVANPAAVVFDAYAQHGPAFAQQLDGQFTVALLDVHAERFVLTNDRFGLYPHYVAQSTRGLCFGPEVKTLLAVLPAKPALDWVAVAQYMRFQHLLGERTFFEGIMLLPPAAVLRVDLRSGAQSLTRYWTFQDVPNRPDIAFRDAVHEGARLLRAAVIRGTSDAHRPGVFLSGGLDSRTLLGLTARRPVASLTYGQPESRDVRYAAQIAQRAGSTHHWADLSGGDWVCEIEALHLDLTEGFHSWIHAHGMSTLPSARAIMDVNLSGWDGGTVMSHPDSWHMWQRPVADEAAMLADDFHNYTQHFTWPGLNDAEEQAIYTADAWSRVRGAAFESFQQEHASAAQYRPDIRRELFYISQHDRRLTQNFVTFTRSHIECRLPYFDYALFDFMFSLPPSARARGRIWHAIIAHATPQLATIPNAADDRLPVLDWRRKAHRYGRGVLRRAQRLIGSPRSPVLLYADYERYLRTDLRAWAEAILFDTRTFARGTFDMTAVRELFERHQRGELHTIGKLAPLMTFERMLRRLHD